MKNIIVNELSSSLKSGDKSRIHTLRLIIAAIKDKEIASRSNGENEEISDEVVINLLKKMIKQRNDSIEQFNKGGRDDLVAKELSEVDVLNKYKPEQLSEDEIVLKVREAISSSDASSMQDIGKVMGLLKNALSGSADMGLVSKIVKDQLS